MNNTKEVPKTHNAEEAIEATRDYVAKKQRLAQKAADANDAARHQDAVYVDKLTNEVWINVPISDTSVLGVLTELKDLGYELVNIVGPQREFIFKYEA